MHGYFLGACKVLYVAGSLRYLRIKHPSFNAHSPQCKRILYAYFQCKKNRWKTCLKILYIEHRVHSYLLVLGKVLYIAGSLRYLRIKHTSFNAHSLQCKRKLHAYFPCKIKRWKKCLKLFYIKHTVHGYFLGVGTVLYIAGSLDNLRIKHPSFNEHSQQCKRTLYAYFPSKINRWKIAWNSLTLNIECMASFWL